MTMFPGVGCVLILLHFAGVGREHAERSSGNAVEQAGPMPELRRQGCLFPANKKINDC
jgi:hypothetical protein